MKLREELTWLKSAAKADPLNCDVSNVLEMIQRNSPYNDAFFEYLDNPSWLLILGSAGHFSSMPGKVIISQDSYRYPANPALTALYRLTPKFPDEVWQTVVGLPPTNNTTVKSQIARIAATLPASHSVRLKHVVIKQIHDSDDSISLWIDEILEKWIKQKFLAECMEVISNFLDVQVENRSADKIDRSTVRLREMDRVVLHPLAEMLPLESAGIIFRSLIKMIQKELPDDTNDTSEYWIDSFSGRTRYNREFEGVLIKRIYEIGKFVFKSANHTDISAFDDLLRSSPRKLFVRLRWRLYADFPEHSLEMARLDVLSKLDDKSIWKRSQSAELVQMLQKHVELYEVQFLNAAEVKLFVSVALDDEFDKTSEIDVSRIRRRQLKRLYPIYPLLDGESLYLYKQLSSELGEPTIEIYNTPEARSGVIQEIPPPEAAQMSRMTDSELWGFVNCWQPGPRSFAGADWLKEESVRALARTFADFVSSHSERFPPEGKWWEQINNLEVLCAPLETAAKRIESSTESQGSPSESEWKTWFGIVTRISAQEDVSIGSADDSTQTKWNYPKLVATRFLKTCIDKAYGNLPEFERCQVGLLLARFASGPDSYLVEDTSRWYSDWFTTAINSVRGNSVEGLLDLALAQKKLDKEFSGESLFKVIREILLVKDQSPAVFAIMGARANLFFHLFGNYIGNATTLLLPTHNPKGADAFVIAHYCYHTAAPFLLKYVPDLPENGLEVLSRLLQVANQDNEVSRSFPERLGVHLAFYYWNASYPEVARGEDILDQYFEIAKSEQRKSAWTQIGNIFSKASWTESNKDLFDRAMFIWDRRYQQVVINNLSIEAQDELAAFSDWLDCECFPFQWRSERFVAILNLLRQAPSSYSVIECLVQWVAIEERKKAAITILNNLLKKATFPDFTWTYQTRQMVTLLQAGLASEDEKTRELADHAQEILLQNRCFEYLDIIPPS